jgi:hypothetical protein
MEAETLTPEQQITLLTALLLKTREKLHISTNIAIELETRVDMLTKALEDATKSNGPKENK